MIVLVVVIKSVTPPIKLANEAVDWCPCLGFLHSAPVCAQVPWLQQYLSIFVRVRPLLLYDYYYCYGEKAKSYYDEVVTNFVATGVVLIASSASFDAGGQFVEWVPMMPNWLDVADHRLQLHMRLEMQVVEPVVPLRRFPEQNWRYRRGFHGFLVCRTPVICNALGKSASGMHPTSSDPVEYGFTPGCRCQISHTC